MLVIIMLEQRVVGGPPPRFPLARRPGVKIRSPSPRTSPSHRPGGSLPSGRRRSSTPSATFALSMSGRLPQTGQPTPAWGATALDEPDKVMRARERAAQAKARELAVHRRAEELHEQAAETQERLGHPDFAQAARERAQQARELHALALREQAEADERATGQHGE
jgi:hypothetical protein